MLICLSFYNQSGSEIAKCLECKSATMVVLRQYMIHILQCLTPHLVHWTVLMSDWQSVRLIKWSVLTTGVKLWVLYIKHGIYGFDSEWEKWYGSHQHWIIFLLQRSSMFENMTSLRSLTYPIEKWWDDVVSEWCQV